MQRCFFYDTQADYIGRSFTATGYSYYLSHNEIQHYMIKGYYMMGNKYGAQVISSGVNFERCLKQFPDIKLYNADNIHPTPTGSYLAACTIYGTIFNTTALENKYLPESEYDSNGLLKKVTKEAALKMQAIADPRLTIDTSYVEVNKGFNSKVTATLIANEKNEIGIVRGLAWTSVGGDTLQIEVNTMPGKGILVLTGNLGDVMKESAQIALSYAKSVAKEYGVEEYVNILLAIIQVESGGTAEDVMQSSESLGLPPNSLSTEESIKQGVKYFSELLASSERLSVDLESVIQSYNYGGGFLGYVANRGNKYTFELAQSFSKEYSGGGKSVLPQSHSHTYQ